MRFTVKAKLASAFGVIICCSRWRRAACLCEAQRDDRHRRQPGVARRPYGPCGAKSRRVFCSRFAREKNLILATESEAERHLADIAKQRETLLKLKEEIHAVASPEGKKLHRKLWRRLCAR